MAIFPGSSRELPNSTPVDVALVDANGDQIPGFDSSRPGNATLTQVVYGAGTVVVLAANPARRSVIIYNATNKPVNIAFAPTASLTVFSFVLAAGATEELPLNGYTGPISAIWQAGATAGTVLHVTEVAS
jgi:hypothetical protein